jgi:hypothetical protein
MKKLWNLICMICFAVSGLVGLTIIGTSLSLNFITFLILFGVNAAAGLMFMNAKVDGVANA